MPLLVANSRTQLFAIWLLEALNYAVHVIIRPVPWNFVSVIIGYCLWAMQLVCLARLQLVDPGSIPRGWEALAASGEEPASVDGKSGRLVPARARYCRRADAVVLGVRRWSLAPSPQYECAHMHCVPPPRC